jgi:cytochrome c-type biogenesis protein CcmH/NrfF
MMRMLSRRELFGVAIAGSGLAAFAADLRAQQDTGRRGADPLFDTTSLERRPAIVEETANDATVKAAELRLACPCPCTLDVFTCRTTDFTCSFSPERHKEVVALVEQGMNVDQVLDAMIRTYGEETLMAPRPQGFNLVGYVVPAAAVLGVGAVIVALLALRQRNMTPAGATAAATDASAVSADELARVERELRDLES